MLRTIPITTYQRYGLRYFNRRRISLPSYAFPSDFFFVHLSQVFQFLLEQLFPVQFRVDPAQRHQLLVRAPAR